MRFVSLVLIFCAFTSLASAATRAPSSVEENSLLYWRYLCRNQPQTQTISSGILELSCMGQNQSWKVRANARDGRVSEVQNETP